MRLSTTLLQKSVIWGQSGVKREIDLSRTEMLNYISVCQLTINALPYVSIGQQYV